MEPRVGLYVKDQQNVYEILDSVRNNTHSQYASDFLVRCIKGPNTGKERWVMRKTILSGSFTVAESD